MGHAKHQIKDLTIHEVFIPESDLDRSLEFDEMLVKFRSDYRWCDLPMDTPVIPIELVGPGFYSLDDDGILRFDPAPDRATFCRIKITSKMPA